MIRTAFDLRKSTFWVCPSLFLMFALWDLSQVYSLMLTVSQSCEDSVTDNYSVRGSGLGFVSWVSQLWNCWEGARSSCPQGMLHTVRGVWQDWVWSCWCRVGFSSLLRVPKNFSFFTIVLSNKDIISILFKLSSFQGCYVLYGYSVSSCQRN